MMRLFGKPKQAPSPADAIQRLRETLELLEKREKYLEKKIENELALAKKNAKQNKRGTRFFFSELVEQPCLRQISKNLYHQ
jgi:hypothetical protein